MFGQDDSQGQLAAWQDEQRKLREAGMGGTNPSGVQLPTDSSGLGALNSLQKQLATPDQRPALPQQAPGGAMPAAWMRQRGSRDWMAENAPENDPTAEAKAVNYLNPNGAQAPMPQPRPTGNGWMQGVFGGGNSQMLQPGYSGGGAAAGAQPGNPLAGPANPLSKGFDPSGAPMPQVAGAAGAGAAGPTAAAGAAGAGGMATAAPYLAVLASFMQKQQADKLARQNMATQIMSRNAAEFGAPTDQIEAQQLNQNLRRSPGTDYLAPVLKQYGYG